MLLTLFSFQEGENVTFTFLAYTQDSKLVVQLRSYAQDCTKGVTKQRSCPRLDWAQLRWWCHLNSCYIAVHVEMFTLSWIVSCQLTTRISNHCNSHPHQLCHPLPCLFVTLPFIPLAGNHMDVCSLVLSLLRLVVGAEGSQEIVAWIWAEWALQTIYL